MSRRRPSPFRKRNALALQDLHYGPNMTPMVDIVMVILIFFMSSAVVLGPEWFLKTGLPSTRPGSLAPGADKPVQFRVALKRDAAAVVATINDQPPMDVPGVETFLKSKLRELPADKIIVLIAPEPNVPYAEVVALHESAQRLGLTKVGIAPPKPTTLPAPDSETPRPALPLP